MKESKLDVKLKKYKGIQPPTKPDVGYRLIVIRDIGSEPLVKLSRLQRLWRWICREEPRIQRIKHRPELISRHDSRDEARFHMKFTLDHVGPDVISVHIVDPNNKIVDELNLYEGKV